MMYAFKFTASAWLVSVILSHLILWWLEYHLTWIEIMKAGATTAAFGAVFIFPLVWWTRGR